MGALSDAPAPVLVEVTRGDRTESRHRGSVAVVDGDGAVRLELGPVDGPVPPRSAVKALQALPLLASGAALGEPLVDGCSAPTWPIPLRDLARAFARFGTGEGLSAGFAAAAERLRAAVAAEPWFVAGSGRFCTEVMMVTGPRAFVKFGAEGVFTAALPELGLGVALKVEDGATRACEVVMATVLARLLPDLDLARFTHPPIRSRRGVVVGQTRPAPLWSDLPS